jgi:LysM repeat protein
MQVELMFGVLIVRTKRSNKRHQQLVLSVLLILITVFALGAVNIPLANKADMEAETVTVVVCKGESLWEIAERFDNNLMNLHKYIDIIMEYNKLENTVLQPGQYLEIPVYHVIDKRVAMKMNLTLLK